MSADTPNLPARRRAQRAVSPERIDTYLRVLEETGSEYEAASAASPHLEPDADGGRPGRKTFEDFARDDPEFAARKSAALSAFMGKAEAALAKRAFEPCVRTSYNKTGQVVGREVRWSDADKLLLRLLARHDPRWREGKNLQVDGRIEHANDDGFGVMLRPQDVLLLDGPDRQEFIRLLGEIRNRRSEMETPNVIDARPGPARLTDARGTEHDSSGGTACEDHRGEGDGGGEG